MPRGTASNRPTVKYLGALKPILVRTFYRPWTRLNFKGKSVGGFSKKLYKHLEQQYKDDVQTIRKTVESLGGSASSDPIAILAQHIKHRPRVGFHIVDS
jgi:hypothetical protein